MVEYALYTGTMQQVFELGGGGLRRMRGQNWGSACLGIFISFF